MLNIDTEGTIFAILQSFSAIADRVAPNRVVHHQPRVGVVHGEGPKRIHWGQLTWGKIQDVALGASEWFTLTVGAGDRVEGFFWIVGVDKLRRTYLAL